MALYYDVEEYDHLYYWFYSYVDTVNLNNHGAFSLITRRK